MTVAIQQPDIHPIQRRRTFADEWNAAIAKMARERMPMDIYPGDSDYWRRIGIKDQIDCLQRLFDLANQLADYVADEAADHLGAHRESVDVLEGAQTDFLDPLRAAVEVEE